MDFERTQPKTLEASRRQVDEPRNVTLRAIRDRHALEMESVSASDRTSLACDADEFLLRVRWFDLDEVDIACRAWKAPHHDEHEASQAVDINGLGQPAIDIMKGSESRDPGSYRA